MNGSHWFWKSTLISLWFLKYEWYLCNNSFYISEQCLMSHQFVWCLEEFQFCQKRRVQRATNKKRKKLPNGIQMILEAKICEKPTKRTLIKKIGFYYQNPDLQKIRSLSLYPPKKLHESENFKEVWLHPNLLPKPKYEIS